MNFRRRLNENQAPLYFNVTSFVDILLVLLAFFLLSWSAMQNESDIGIKLPTASSGTPPQNIPVEVFVNVKADGSVQVNQRSLNDPQLQSLLQGLIKIDPQQLVIVRADRNAPYATVLHVLDLCRGAGVTDVGFSAIPQQSGGSGSQ
jgi:biopolymer transport protein ExbD